MTKLIQEAENKLVPRLTIKDIEKELNQKLKGKQICAFGKNSKGLWGKSDTSKTFEINKIEFKNWDNESGYLNVHLKDYKALRDGLIYTDPRWLREFKQLLKEENFMKKYFKEVNYSDHGSQGDKFVNLDVWFKGEI